MGLSQKEATYNAVKSALELKGFTFEDGEDVCEAVTPDTKKEIKAILFEGFRSGTVAYTENFASKILNDDSELNKYISGLISNWLKKDKRLNGNTKYQPQNPGSRAGQGDEQVKELRKLLKITRGTDAEAEVKKALDARVAEIKAAKRPEIDASALPEHLRHLV